MSKRKNMCKYVPAVQQWDELIGMDKTGYFDKNNVIANVNLKEAMDVLTLAVNNCIMQFENHPSVPALDACVGLIYEGKSIGLDISFLEEKVNSEWNKFRKNWRSPFS